jgi:hypothetical protein
MPFGPMHGPATYTAMMFELKGEWLSLFRERHPEQQGIVAESRTIIDDILNWCTNPEVLVDLFEYICIVFLKYRVSFRLYKCGFFVNIIEYVGHDITSDGNIPAQSKHDTIQDWLLPKTAKSMLSFVSHCSFYQRYVPWFEVGIKELRRMVRQYSRKAITPVEWTETRVALFDSMKEALTSSHVMARFNSSTPVFSQNRLF